MELYQLTIHEIRDLLEKREISSAELTQLMFKYIESVEPKVNSYITLTYEMAKEQANDADEQISKGINKPLLGVPIAIKDLISTKGVKTTCASKILHNYVPPYDATVIKRLREKGAVFLGKTNMDEFAMGSSNETSYFGPVRNPWDLDYVPGGSSGGSASAVCAGECIAALGSDTGGSIRQPASFCGVVGLKPTYGRVSRFGLIAFASSLDQIGPITKDVKDAAILLNVISGNDLLDSTSATVSVPDFTESLNNDISGLKIGIPKEYFIAGIDREVEDSINNAINLFKKMGAYIKEVSLPHTDYAISTYYVIAPAEASSNLARYDGVKYGFRAEDPKTLLDMYKKTRKEGFGNEVKRRIMLGTYALSSGYYDAYYLKAQKVRTLIKQDIENVFKEVDILVTPTSPTPAFKLGEKKEDPLKMYLSDIFTIPVNLAGVPAMSIPCGFSAQNLPIGFQIIGRHLDEETILKAGYAFQMETDYHLTRPKL